MSTLLSFFTMAFLLLDKNGKPLEMDPHGDGLTMDFFTPGLLLTLGAIVYAVAITIVRRKKPRLPFSYTYWLVFGSGIAMILVPFVGFAIASIAGHFGR